MSIKKKEKLRTQQNKEANFLDQLKEKPGFVIAAIIFIFLCILLFTIPKINISDGLLAGGYAKSMHENNQAMIDYYLEGIDLQITGQYDDTITDDQLFSMRNDFLWLKNRDNEIFNSKPSTDVLVKEMAFSYFTEQITTINQDFLFDFEFSSQTETIEKARTASYTSTNVFSAEVEELFSGEVEKRALFVKTYNELMQEYVTTKITLLNSDAEQERKFVEAIKILLATA